MPANSPMSLLTAEHRNLISIVQDVESDQTSLKSGILKADTKQRIEKLTEFLQKHITKEEQVLFPVLSRKGGMDRMVINAMHLEHKKISAELSRVSSHLDKAPLSQALLTSLYWTFDLLRAHISKEDNVLFWFAEIKIPQHLHYILIKEMDAIEQSTAHLKH